MKKILALALAVLQALSLCACYSADVLNDQYKVGYDEGYAQAAKDAEYEINAAYDDGYDDGISVYDDAYDEGHHNGYLSGYDDGYIEGYKDGFDDGIEERDDNEPYNGDGLVWQYTPDSSAFYAIAYDVDELVLAVIFNSNKTRTYLYYGFSETAWEAFTGAEALGKYYDENIKGQYHGARIEEISGTNFEP